MAPPAVASSAPAARPPLAPCEAIAQLQREEYAASRKEESESSPLSGPLEGVASELGTCFPFKGGAWALVAHSARTECPDGSCEESPHLLALAVSVDIVLVKGTAAPVRRPTYGIERGMMFNSQIAPAVFDYDGDGAPEIIIHQSSRAHESRQMRRGDIWTSRGAEIVPYAPAAALEFVDTVDVDGDGRPDLDLGPAYEGDIVPCGMDGISIEVGPHRVAHSLATGAFSTDDAAVRAHFRAACPARPKAVVTKAKKGIDNDALRRDVVCSRLWGASTKDVVSALDRGCRAPAANVDACAYEGVIPACVNVSLLHTWATLEPPVRLDRLVWVTAAESGCSRNRIARTCNTPCCCSRRRRRCCGSRRTNS